MLHSVAGQCVCGPQHFEGIPTSEDPRRPGAHTEHVTADGGRIPNWEEKLVKGISGEGSPMAIIFQVTHVGKPLIAVSKLTAAGHEAWFCAKDGTVTNTANGKTAHFLRKDNVYVMQIWVKKPNGQLSGGSRQ